MYVWDFKWVWGYREQLWQGLLATIWLNVWVLVLGTMLGVIIGLMSRHRSRVMRYSTRSFVDLFRTLPILVLLVWFYFCVPILAGGIRISAFWSATIVLSLNLAAFVSEIVRAGIEAVPRVHSDDGFALGMKGWQVNRFIVLPVALRVMVPPLVGQFINSVKLSVLASVIAVPELLNRTTDVISQVYRPLELYTALAILFLMILLPGTILSRYLERRVARLNP